MKSGSKLKLPVVVHRIGLAWEDLETAVRPESAGNSDLILRDRIQPFEQKRATSSSLGAPHQTLQSIALVLAWLCGPGNFFARALNHVLAGA